VLDLTEYAETLDVTNAESAGVAGFVGVRRLEGRVLDGLPAGVGVGSCFRAAGPRLDARLLLLGSDGTVRSDGRYALRVSGAGAAGGPGVSPGTIPLAFVEG
jgi:hypothetical protein